MLHTGRNKNDKDIHYFCTWKRLYRRLPLSAATCSDIQDLSPIIPSLAEREGRINKTGELGQ